MPTGSNEEAVLSAITRMLRLTKGADRLFPATVLYNESWLLRLVLDWFSREPPSASPMSLQPGARWYSEAPLRSQFQPRQLGDKLAEGTTYADAAIGHVEIGQGALANCELQNGATQLVVVEAKLGSPLSPGVTHAPWFDQAARNVACIAELLSRRQRNPESMSVLRFIVAAPEAQISTGAFTQELTLGSIRAKVSRRANSYEEPYKAQKVKWLQEWFEPVLEKIVIESRSWESILREIKSSDPDRGAAIQDFYDSCIEFNPIRSRAKAADYEREQS